MFLNVGKMLVSRTFSYYLLLSSESLCNDMEAPKNMCKN